MTTFREKDCYMSSPTICKLDAVVLYAIIFNCLSFVNAALCFTQEKCNSPSFRLYFTLNLYLSLRVMAVKAGCTGPSFNDPNERVNRKIKIKIEPLDSLQTANSPLMAVASPKPSYNLPHSKAPSL